MATAALEWLSTLWFSLSWLYIFIIAVGAAVVITSLDYRCRGMTRALQKILPNFLVHSKVVNRRDMAEQKGKLIEEEPYRQKLRTVLNMSFKFPNAPGKLLDHLYIGAEHDATNLRLLRDLKITHVINTVEGYCHTGKSYYGNKVKYMGFDAEDDERYNIMQHFEKTYEFIEDARKNGGRAFIHCLMGINRSGALAVGYVMLHENVGPITAGKMAKKQRNIILTNDHFQRQLIHLANQKGLLELDKNEL